MRDMKYCLQLTLLAFDQAAYLLKTHQGVPLKKILAAAELRFIYIACVVFIMELCIFLCVSTCISN